MCNKMKEEDQKKNNNNNKLNRNKIIQIIKLKHSNLNISPFHSTTNHAQAKSVTAEPAFKP